MAIKGPTNAFHGTIYLMAAHLAMMGGSYVIAVVLARGLGPELYGVYGLVYSVLLAVELIGRLGFPQAVSKLIAESEDESAYEASGFTLSLIVYGIIFLVFWFAAPFLSQVFNTSDGTRLFKIAAIDIPFYGVYFMLVHILTGRRQFLQQSIATLIYISTKVLGILALVYLGASVEGALVVNIIGSVVALGLVIPLIGIRPFRVSFANAKPIVSLAGPAALIALGTQFLTGVDLWLLNALGSEVAEATKGQYVAALNVARIPNVVAFVMISILVPTIARALRDEDRASATVALSGATKFMAVGLIGGCAVIAVNADEVMSLLFSSSYANGGRLLVVLIFSQGLFFTFYMVLSNVLISTGSAVQSAILSLVVVVVASIVCATLIALAGAVGAAYGALFAAAGAAIAVFVILFRSVKFVPDWTMLLRVLFISAIVAGLSKYVSTEGVNLILELCIAALIYSILIPIFGLVTRKDLELLGPRFTGRSAPNPAIRG